MLPILPILILLLLGPANAERLAVEGRLPAALLAVHRAMVVPVRVTIVAQAEEESGTASSQNAFRPVVRRRAKWTDAGPLRLLAAPGCPTRAGP